MRNTRERYDKMIKDFHHYKSFTPSIHKPEREKSRDGRYDKSTIVRTFKAKRHMDVTWKPD